MRRIILLLMFILPLQAGASNINKLPVAIDFRQDARQSQQQRIPIMVFYMSDNCGYCETVSDLYLEPMIRNGEDKGRVILRTVNIGGIKSLKGFDGQVHFHEAFAEAEGVNFTPVIKFYDHEGKELVPEILGYQSPDFYAGYLEQSINNSIARLRYRRNQ